MMRERDKIRSEHIRGTRAAQASKKSREKKIKVVWPCDEDERGTHSEKNARCRHTRERRRGRPSLRWKDACKRDMTEAELNEDNTTKREEKNTTMLTLGGSDGVISSRALQQYSNAYKTTTKSDKRSARTSFTRHNRYAFIKTIHSTIELSLGKY